MRLGGQLRFAGPGVVGVDMNAALSMGRALGICQGAVAFLLPEIEAVMIREINKQLGSQGHV